VELVFALHRGRHSGRLKITHGRRFREIYFIGGLPVVYRSDLPDEKLERTLVYADLIPEDRIKWIADKLSPGEKLEDALVMSGSVTQEQLEEHQRSRTRPGISGPLTWSSGDWTFEALLPQVTASFDSALLDEESALPSLWNGVSQHVGTDEVLPAVTDAKKGDLTMNEEGRDMLESLGLVAPFDTIQDAIGEGASVEDIFRTIPDNTGGLFKLLWMLENGGAVQRENGSWKGEMDASLQKAVENSGENKSAKTKAKKRASSKEAEIADSGMDINEEIALAHSERMGQDFYTFLGIDSASPRKEVDKACKTLAQRWRSADSTSGLTKEARSQLKDLLAGVQLSWRTLTDPKHKREYDRRLEMGRAPIVEVRVSRAGAKLPPKAKKPNPKAEEREEVSNEEQTNADMGRALLNSNKFSEAAAMLEEARLENPSDPTVLADLGWARWKARQWGTDDSAPEEFLRLALTFEPQNTRALEFLARISIEKGETDKAQKILKRILKISPGSEWARSALLSQQKGQRSETVTRRGFWRGKGDKE